MTYEEARIELECQATNIIGEYASIEMPKPIKRLYEATDLAIETLKNADKYKWHDLRKDPYDMPKVSGDYELCVRRWSSVTECWIEKDYVIAYFNKYLNSFNYDNVFYMPTIYAWRYFEPFEEEE